MPFIRMTKTTEKPARKKGKLYNVPFPESWHLVRDRFAEHEYVPEAKVASLTESDAAVKPKKPKVK